MIAIVGAVMGLLIVGLGVVVLTILGCVIWKKSKSGQYVLQDKEQQQEGDLRRNSAYNGNYLKPLRPLDAYPTIHGQNS